MGNPRTKRLLVATALAIVGLIGWAWLGAEPHSVPSVVTVGRIPLAANVVINRPAEAAPLQVQACDPVIAAPRELPADANVLVVAMCDLQLMAADTDLSLDSDQWSALATVVVKTQAIRHNYEGEIATWQTIAPHQYRVDIPMYARVGDELRRQFTAELRAGLGEATATEVLAKLGGRLEASFAGFGVSWQTFEIRGDPISNPCDVRIAQTASYWNSVDGGDKLAIRSEMHFPAIEDPTGDRWGALLAMAGKLNADNGPI